jgi:metal-dependent amidase/aminoacylase/carboxypeptidase family protein
LQAGTHENVIPDEAVIKLNVRSFDEGVRRRVLAAIERIVKAEAAASGAPRPPEITPLDRYPLTVNNPAASKRVADAFRRHFSADRACETGPTPASEDFGSFGAEWHAPSVFWFVGGTDPDRYTKAKETGRLNEIPTNHSPRFAPVIECARQSWRYPAGGSPAQVRGSARLVASVAWSSVTAVAKRTQRSCGVGY